MEFSNTKSPVFLLLSMNETFVVSCSCSYNVHHKITLGRPPFKNYSSELAVAVWNVCAE